MVDIERFRNPLPEVRGWKPAFLSALRQDITAVNAARLANGNA